MTKTKITKRALLASALSLLLCVSMLVGSTFAWFTDSASTGVNTIISGNLDVGLKYSKDFNTWNNAEAQTEIFDKDALWEPGYTEVVYFEVENKGNLAFNYRVGTNLVSNNKGLTEDDKEIDLTKYIKFGIVPVTAKFDNRDMALSAVKNEAVDFANLFVAENSLNEKGDTQRFAMVVFMPSSVGNEANHGTGKTAPSIQFGVQVVATQKAQESDSFNEKYDENATYPEFAFVTYQPETELVLEGENFNATIPADAELQTEDGQAIADGTGLVMKVEQEEVTESNIEINIGDVVLPYEITLETDDGEKVKSTKEDITVRMFIGKDRGTIKLYHYNELVEGTSYDSDTGILTFKTRQFSPYTIVEIGIIEADTSWYVDENASEYVINTADELLGLSSLVASGNKFENKTIKLGKDIDLKNAKWMPIGNINNPFSGNFDGNNKTISNLYIDYPDKYYVGLIGYTCGSEVKNVTINNAHVYSGTKSGVLVGTVDNNDAKFSDIKFTGRIKFELNVANGGLLVGHAQRTSVASVTDVTVDVDTESYAKSVTDNTNYWEYLGGVWGNCWPVVAKDIYSNINVYGYASNIGGIGGGCAASSENIVSEGNVTVTIYDTEVANGYACALRNGTIYGFGVTSNVLNKSGTHTNCSATGTLSIAGKVITDPGIAQIKANGYKSNDVRFGAPYTSGGVITVID